MGKTSKDYKKELEETRLKLKSIEGSVKARLLKMVVMFPDSVILKKGEDLIKAKFATKEWIDTQSTDSMIELIRNIEEYNLSLQPNKQLEFDY